MRRPPPTRSSRRQQGAVLVEFVVLLPCLLLLLFTVSEGAGMIATHQILNNAAREGARLSISPGEQGDTAGVTARVVAYANANGVALTAANVSVNQDVIVPVAGACSAANPCLTASQVTVTYSYPLQYLPNFATGVPVTVPLSNSVEMRNFY